MRVLSTALLSAALGLALAPVPVSAAAIAPAKVSGHCEHEGRRVALVDGLAWVVPGEEDDEDYGGYEDEVPAPPPILLAFVTFPIDAGEVARATDREDALRDQSWKPDEAARLQLSLEGETVGQQYLWMSPGSNLSYSSNEVGHYVPGKAGKDRVAGQYRFRPEDGQDLDCAVQFDVPLLGDPADAPPLPGDPLPPGGGEPGKAYLALNAAMRAGDFDALARLMPPERAAQMQEARQSPDFAGQMAFAQAMAPTDVRITGGRVHGDQAWLQFTAKEAGEPRAGEAEMKLTGGRWILVSESTRDPD